MKAIIRNSFNGAWKLFFRMIPIRLRYRILSALMKRASADLAQLAVATDFGAFTEGGVENLLDDIFTILEKSGKNRKELLECLLRTDNRLYRLISQCARQYNGGQHPKHRLTGYHNFFCCNVGPEETVLDIGCGNGLLTSDIAKCTTGRVVGIDMNRDNIEFARAHFRANNLDFVLGDVTTGIQSHCFDVVVMSNVLEHLSNRVEFLSGVRDTVQPKKLLLRVPMFEREWMAPLKRELGVDYMLDPTHKIEHRQEEFFEELWMAGFQPEYCELKWGEIWCRAQPGAAERREDGE